MGQSGLSSMRMLPRRMSGMMTPKIMKVEPENGSTDAGERDRETGYGRSRSFGTVNHMAP